MNGKGWARAAAAGLLATVAVVGLHEGKAYLALAQERGALAPASPLAGERQLVSRDAAGLRSGSAGAPAAPKSGAGEAANEAARITLQLEQVKSKLTDVRREKRDLEARLRSLENELASRPAGSPTGAADEFELDRDDWKALAAESRVKYRIPCALPADASYALPEDQLEELGLTPEDGRTLLEAQRRSNARVWAALRPQCVQAVGDDSIAELMGRSGCIRVIERSATKHDPAAAATARRQVAEVHAGLRAPPAAGQSSPLFDALLALTSEAQHFEADLADSFGGDEAQRIAGAMRCADTTR